MPVTQPGGLLAFDVAEPLPPPSVLVRELGAQLNFGLCDVWGNRLALLTNYTGGKITLSLNGQRRVNDLAVSLEDDAAQMVMALARTLKVYMDDFLLANVILTTPQFRGSDSRVVLNGVDPSFVLERRFVEASTSYGPSDYGDIIMSLVQVAQAQDHAGYPPVGVIVDPALREKTKDVNRTYEPGQQIWAAMTDLAGQFDGPDFELRPVDRTDGQMVELHIFKKMGTDRSASVIFEYNCGRNNCRDFTYDPAGDSVKNQYTVVGQAQEASNPPKYKSEALAQQAKYRMLAGYESVGDVPAETLKAKAQQQTSAYAAPPPFFSFAPNFEGKTEQSGTPPECLFDYFLGDTVSGLWKEEGWTVFPPADWPGQTSGGRGTGRVTEITLDSIDSAGNVQVAVTCVPTILAGTVT